MSTTTAATLANNRLEQTIASVGGCASFLSRLQLNRETLRRRISMVDLVRLESALRLHRPAAAASLQRGARESDLADFERRCGVRLTAEHRQLYLWRDGQSPDSEAAPRRKGRPKPYRPALGATGG